MSRIIAKGEGRKNDIGLIQKKLNFAPCMNKAERYTLMLRISVLILLIFTGFHSRAQTFDCTILPGDTTVMLRPEYIPVHGIC